MPRAALERAISALDGITHFSRELGLNSHGVAHQWRLTRVPAEHCPAIERLTREAAAAKADPALVVLCEELRPDVQWAVLRDQTA